MTAHELRHDKRRYEYRSACGSVFDWLWLLGFALPSSARACALAAKARVRAFGPCCEWRVRANVWREVTNPAGGLKRQRGDQQSAPYVEYSENHRPNRPRDTS